MLLPQLSQTVRLFETELLYKDLHGAHIEESPLSIEADEKVEIVVCYTVIIDIATVFITLGSNMVFDVDGGSLLCVRTEVIELLLNFFNLQLTLATLLLDRVIEAATDLEEFLSRLDLLYNIRHLLKLCLSLLKCLLNTLLYQLFVIVVILETNLKINIVRPHSQFSLTFST